MTGTVRALVESAASEEPRHLGAIYAFVERFRPGTAAETVRARVYEAVKAGRLARIAEGIYFARSGPATLLLVQGDARDVLAQLDDEVLDAIVTDPPYDLGTKGHAETGTTRPRGRSYDQFDLDRATLQHMFRVLRKDRAWRLLEGEARGGAPLLLFVPARTRTTRPHIESLVRLAEEVGFVFYGEFVWDQRTLGMGYDAGRTWHGLLLLFHAGERNGLLWDLGVPSVLSHAKLGRRDGEHEAEKPVGLFMDLVRALTRPGDLLADFFAGRGRWLRHAVQAGRHVLAVEKDVRWVARIRADFETGAFL